LCWLPSVSLGGDEVKEVVNMSGYNTQKGVEHVVPDQQIKQEKTPGEIERLNFKAKYWGLLVWIVPCPYVKDHEAQALPKK